MAMDAQSSVEAMGRMVYAMAVVWFAPKVAAYLTAKDPKKESHLLIIDIQEMLLWSQSCAF